MADYMGPAPKKNIIPGHALPEEAFIKLYLLTRERPELAGRLPVPVQPQRYLDLAEFWLQARGDYRDRQSLGAYAQDHQPILQQATAEGHAVRAMLTYNGLATACRVNGRQDYLEAAQRIWNNLAQRRTYITGAVGAVAEDEKFGPDYLLPNDGYLETCAAAGAGFFHHTMNLLTGDARYADELERTLYNGVLSGVSIQGDTYFYQNPLETNGHERWRWHECPCCPPMLLKIVTELPRYIYAFDDDNVFVNLYAESSATVPLKAGPVGLQQKTDYPWGGEVTLTVNPESSAEFTLHLRIPGWARGAPALDGLYRYADETGAVALRVNDEPVELEMHEGFAQVRRQWRPGDTIHLSLPLAIQRVRAHPSVEADAGRVALQRGPIVYCVEGADHKGRVKNLLLPRDTELVAQYRSDLLGGVTVLKGTAVRAGGRKDEPVEMLAVPYYANSNRGATEVVVWLPES
jgi:DUF1680 family protein